MYSNISWIETVHIFIEVYMYISLKFSNMFYTWQYLFYKMKKVWQIGRVVIEQWRLMCRKKKKITHPIASCGFIQRDYDERNFKLDIWYVHLITLKHESIRLLVRRTMLKPQRLYVLYCPVKSKNDHLSNLVPPWPNHMSLYLQDWQNYWRKSAQLVSVVLTEA